MGSESSAPTLGLALGSGASRGWSHIGIIKALVDAGIEPDVVCGTSVGAMVGGAYAAGKLEVLADWVLASKKTDVFRFFSLKPNRAGFVDLERFREFLHRCVGPADLRVEDLAKPFAAVATDLGSSREVWLTKGVLADVVGASMAMPGLFPAVGMQHRWLVDGGLVNPVPVSVCRALGADVVIAVNLNSNIVGKWRKSADSGDPEDSQAEAGVLQNIKKQARDVSSSLFGGNEEKASPPGLFQAIPGAISIFQDRITRSRLAGDPADVLIAPQVADIGILEFQRAGEAMQKGQEAARLVLSDIQRIIANWS
ncbi:MAG: patatin-like phospholipase family protein [Xanthomonadales bacterium]|nr:patatin-like phospholipase family protein [Xanthomonadales bacterium]